MSMKVGSFMSKLNAFHKDLLILFFLLVVQLLISLFFPLTNQTVSTLNITANLPYLNIEADGETYRYLPILPVLYAFLIVGLLMKKEKPLTLIYGIGLMLVAKINFITQMLQLEGTNSNVYFGNLLTKTVTIDSRVVAQDLTIYIILILIVIKGAIVIYQFIDKHFLSERKTQSNPNENTA